MPSLLTACSPNSESDFEGNVLIIGAGAAGLSAGYLLAQKGVPFQIIEAAAEHGGRMRHNTSFADFPIPLGAEWLHTTPNIFANIVNDPEVEVGVETKPYTDQDQVAYFETDELTYYALGDYGDQKFIGSSWFGFFEQYIVPSVRENILFEREIVTVDYSGEQVRLTDSSGETFVGDKVIVTVPLKILQDGAVSFVPPLPSNIQAAIAEAIVWSGLKVFLEFSEKFYPAFVEFPDSDTSQGQRLYYDAAYGQGGNTHILGLFAVGAQSEAYQALSDEALLAQILAELDEIFEGAASQSYVMHLVQNWNAEPFARAAYLADVSPAHISRTLSRSVDGKLFFAGEAYTQENDWGSVHNATRSARDAVDELVG